MEGYNPSVSLLPAGSGAIIAMKGGFMEPPQSYDYSKSMLPDIPGEITHFKGGAAALSENTIDITSESKTVYNTGSIKDSIKDSNKFSQQCMLISLWHYVRYCRNPSDTPIHESDPDIRPDSNQQYRLYLHNKPASKTFAEFRDNINTALEIYKICPKNIHKAHQEYESFTKDKPDLNKLWPPTQEYKYDGGADWPTTGSEAEKWTTFINNRKDQQFVLDTIAAMYELRIYIRYIGYINGKWILNKPQLISTYETLLGELGAGIGNNVEIIAFDGHFEFYIGGTYSPFFDIKKALPVSSEEFNKLEFTNLAEYVGRLTKPSTSSSIKEHNTLEEYKTMLTFHTEMVKPTIDKILLQQSADELNQIVTRLIYDMQHPHKDTITETEIDNAFALLTQYHTLIEEINMKISTSRVITVHPIVHKGTNDKTHFETLIKNNKHALFIYNENFVEINSGYMKEGGGNAVIRPYRQDVKGNKTAVGFSLGVPTGFLDITKVESKYNTNIDTNKLDIIHSLFTSVPFNTFPRDDINDTTTTMTLLQSLYNIHHYIYDNPKITDVYYSAPTADKRIPNLQHQLGLGIFKGNKWTQDNIAQINTYFNALFTELSRIFTLKRPDGTPFEALSGTPSEDVSGTPSGTPSGNSSNSSSKSSSGTSSGNSSKSSSETPSETPSETDKIKTDELLKKIREYLKRQPDKGKNAENIKDFKNAENIKDFKKYGIHNNIKEYLDGPKRDELRTLLNSYSPSLIDKSLNEIAFVDKNKNYRVIIHKLLQLALQQTFSSTLSSPSSISDNAGIKLPTPPLIPPFPSSNNSGKSDSGSGPGPGGPETPLKTPVVSAASSVVPPTGPGPVPGPTATTGPVPGPTAATATAAEAEATRVAAETAAKIAANTRAAEAAAKTAANAREAEIAAKTAANARLAEAARVAAARATAIDNANVAKDEANRAATRATELSTELEQKINELNALIERAVDTRNQIVNNPPISANITTLANDLLTLIGMARDRIAEAVAREEHDRNNVIRVQTLATEIDRICRDNTSTTTEIEAIMVQVNAARDIVNNIVTAAERDVRDLTAATAVVTHSLTDLNDNYAAARVAACVAARQAADNARAVVAQATQLFGQLNDEIKTADDNAMDAATANQIASNSDNPGVKTASDTLLAVIQHTNNVIANAKKIIQRGNANNADAEIYATRIENACNDGITTTNNIEHFTLLVTDRAMLVNTSIRHAQDFRDSINDANQQIATSLAALQTSQAVADTEAGQKRLDNQAAATAAKAACLAAAASARQAATTAATFFTQIRTEITNAEEEATAAETVIRNIINADNTHLLAHVQTVRDAIIAAKVGGGQVDNVGNQAETAAINATDAGNAVNLPTNEILAASDRANNAVVEVTTVITNADISRNALRDATNNLTAARQAAEAAKQARQAAAEAEQKRLANTATTTGQKPTPLSAEDFPKIPPQLPEFAKIPNTSIQKLIKALFPKVPEHIIKSIKEVDLPDIFKWAPSSVGPSSGFPWEDLHKMLAESPKLTVEQIRTIKEKINTDPTVKKITEYIISNAIPPELFALMAGGILRMRYPNGIIPVDITLPTVDNTSKAFAIGLATEDKAKALLTELTVAPTVALESDVSPAALPEVLHVPASGPGSEVSPTVAASGEAPSAALPVIPPVSAASPEVSPTVEVPPAASPEVPPASESVVLPGPAPEPEVPSAPIDVGTVNAIAIGIATQGTAHAQIPPADKSKEVAPVDNENDEPVVVAVAADEKQKDIETEYDSHNDIINTIKIHLTTISTQFNAILQPRSKKSTNNLDKSSESINEYITKITTFLANIKSIYHKLQKRTTKDDKLNKRVIDIVTKYINILKTRITLVNEKTNKDKTFSNRSRNTYTTKIIIMHITKALEMCNTILPLITQINLSIGLSDESIQEIRELCNSVEPHMNVNITTTWQQLDVQKKPASASASASAPQEVYGQTLKPDTIKLFMESLKSTKQLKLDNNSSAAAVSNDLEAAFNMLLVDQSQEEPKKFIGSGVSTVNPAIDSPDSPADIVSTTTKDVTPDSDVGGFNKLMEAYIAHMYNELRTPLLIKILSLSVKDCIKLFSTDIFVSKGIKTNNDYLSYLVNFIYIDLSSFNGQDAIFKLLSGGITYKAFQETPLSKTNRYNFKKLQNHSAEESKISEESTTDSDTSLYIYIDKFLELLKGLLKKKHMHETIELYNALGPIIIEHNRHYEKLHEAWQFINNTDINQDFHDTLEQMLESNNNDNILTFLKLRCDDDRFQTKSKRFHILINGKKTTIIVRYDDRNQAFYVINENNPLNPVRDLNIPPIYNHTYVLGPYNRIFMPKETNGAIASDMEVIKTKLLAGLPVFILGYGASGAGKTSSLIYYNKGTTPETKNGVLIHLCDQLGLAKAYDTIELSYIEFYYDPIDNQLVQIHVPAAAGTSIKFKFDTINKSFQSEAEYKHNNNHTYRTRFIEPDAIKTKTFAAGTLLGEFIIHLVDTDRFVKATTNNPNSSRSHVLVFIHLSHSSDPTKNAFLIFGDFAGVENAFTCNDPATKEAIGKIKREHGDLKDGKPNPVTGNFYYSDEPMTTAKRGYKLDPVDGGGLGPAERQEKALKSAQKAFAAKSKTSTVIPPPPQTDATRKMEKQIQNMLKSRTNTRKKVPVPQALVVQAPVPQAPVPQAPVVQAPVPVMPTITYDSVDTTQPLYDFGNPIIRESWKLDSDLANHYASPILMIAIDLVRTYAFPDKTKMTDASIPSTYAKINPSELIGKVRLGINEEYAKITEALKTDLKTQCIISTAYQYLNPQSRNTSGPSGGQLQREHNRIIQQIRTILIKVINETYLDMVLAQYPIPFMITKFTQTNFDYYWNIVEKIILKQIKSDYESITKLLDTFKQHFASIPQDVLKEHIEKILSNIPNKHGIFPTFIDLVANLEIETFYRNQIYEKICNNRVKEGKFINGSLEDISNTIKQILYVKNYKENNSVIPNFINRCYDNYFPDNTSSFTPAKASTTHLRQSVIFKALQSYLITKNPQYESVEKFCKDIIIGVFCVFNISRKANNPPPTPYLDIDKLQHFVDTEYDENTMNQLKEIGQSIIEQIEGTFSDKLSALTSIKSKLEPNFTVFQLFKDMVNENEVLTKDTYIRWKDYIDEFIDMINNSNAVSAIGTLRFLDFMAKYNTIKTLCKQNENLSFKDIAKIVVKENCNPIYIHNKPIPKAPIMATIEAPVTATTETPVTSTIETPVKPTTETPVKPTTETPVKPTTETPVKPTIEAPVKPTIEAPVTPTRIAVKPGIGTRVKSTTGPPVTSTTRTPVKPTTRTPVTSTTRTPVKLGGPPVTSTRIRVGGGKSRRWRTIKAGRRKQKTLKK